MRDSCPRLPRQRPTPPDLAALKLTVQAAVVDGFEDIVGGDVAPLRCEFKNDCTL